MTGSSESLAARAGPWIFVFMWSTGFIGAKFGLPYAEPMTFLSIRMSLVVVIFLLISMIARPTWPDPAGIGHSLISGALVQGVYLGGVPAGLSALIPGLQPILTSILASRWLGERTSFIQWLGLALGLIGVVLVLYERPFVGSGTVIGWIAAFLSLMGITLGTLYQKRYCGGIDWRAGNGIQYAGAALMFTTGAFLFETRTVEWNVEFVMALTWLVIVMSVGAVGLMYWLIRRTAATRVASLFYLIPAVTALMAWALFGERLGAIAVAGMVICAAGVFLINRSQV